MFIHLRSNKIKATDDPTTSSSEKKREDELKVRCHFFTRHAFQARALAFVWFLPRDFFEVGGCGRTSLFETRNPMWCCDRGLFVGV